VRTTSYPHLASDPKMMMRSEIRSSDGEEREAKLRSTCRAEPKKEKLSAQRLGHDGGFKFVLLNYAEPVSFIPFYQSPFSFDPLPYLFILSSLSLYSLDHPFSFPL